MFYDDGVTILTILSVVLGCLIMSIKLVFQLKCKELKCCGNFCSLIRSVELENFDVIPNNSPNTNNIV